MRSLDIVNQLKIMLPRYTDYFHDGIGISDVTVSGSVATITTTAAHGLYTNEAVTISDYYLKNKIVSIEDYEGSEDYKLITVENTHDVTKHVSEEVSVTLGGFSDDSFNTSYDVYYAGRENLVIGSSDTFPALTGDEYMEEYRYNGLNGQHSVNVIDSTTFSLNTAILDGIYDGGALTSNVRVGVAFDMENALDMYTQHGVDEYWIFVIMKDTMTSRSNNTTSDALTDISYSSSLSLNIVDGFDIIVIFPSSTYSNPGTVLDIARHDLEPIMNKCLLKVAFDTEYEGKKQFVTVFTGSGQIYSNKAVFIYGYGYEFTYIITDEDTVSHEGSTAFRNLDFTTNGATTSGIHLQDNL